MSDRGGSAFRIGAFVVEPRRNLVRGPDGEIALQPKVMDVLCLLADKPGEVVSRDELIDRIWGVEFGADESLTRAISLLRKAFADSRDQPAMIETIAKRGYRLVAVPVPAARTGEAAPAAPIVHRFGRRRWIAAAAGMLLLIVVAVVWYIRSPSLPPRGERTGIVLLVGPFEASGPVAADIADALSAKLARSPLVRARPAAAGAADQFVYRLRGAILSSGPAARIDWQLLDNASGDIVWSGARAFRAGDRRSLDEAVDAIGSEAFLPLFRSVKTRLEQQTVTSLEPWALTLLVTWVPGDEARPTGPPSEESYWLQKRALAIDPDFAPAHALFAELAAYHALFDPPYDTQPLHGRALGHARRAIELAPYDPEVLYQLGLYYRFAGDRERSEALLRRVVELQPNHPLARLDLAFVRGQCSRNADASIGEIEAIGRTLSASNPVRWVALAHLANLQLSRGDYAKAREAALRSRQIVPITWTAMTLAAAETELGHPAAARAVLAEHHREWPRMDMRYFAERIVPRWCLGGDRTAAVQQAFQRLADETREP